MEFVVAAYGLTVEEGTPLARGVARGTIAMPSDDEVGDAMEAVAARLEGAGLRRYRSYRLRHQYGRGGDPGGG